MFFRLAYKSLLSRKGSVVLALLAISVSVFVMLGIEHIRYQAKESFSKTVSGIDLIVGARTGDINLLLYSVFRLGNPTNNIQWQTYQAITKHPKVAWTIPISLGDSHKGYRVLGTTTNYFEHFRYGRKQPLTFSEGKAFKDIFDVVIGAEVAKALNYRLGDKLVIAHGLASTSFSLHDDKPFEVVGILAPTGTPVDQTLHVSLEGIEAIHIDWQGGVRIPGREISAEDVVNHDLTPKNITAMMVGLTSKMATFSVQRAINNYRKEPLSAILPGVALTQLWQMMSVMEKTLQLVSMLVLAAALLGLSAMLLTSIRERRHEIAILRMLGAPPRFLFLLIELEAFLITLVAVLFAGATLSLLTQLLKSVLAEHFGLFISANIFSSYSLLLLAGILLSSLVIGAIPAIAAYIKARQTN